MKVFLSWSGDLSHKVACILRDWLPSVIQAVRPYVSSEDIDKGTRWSSDIAQELEESTFGIICVTRENLVAPWINFEAGALSKTIDKSFVSPFLFRIKRSEVHGPLLQFQSTVYEKEDVAKLMVTINARLPEADRLGDNQLRKSFEIWWPELQAQLDALHEGKAKPIPVKEEAQRQDRILEELLELARIQQRLLRSPEDLLPSGYLRNALTGLVADETPQAQMRELVRAYDRIVNVIRIVRRAQREQPNDTNYPGIYEFLEQVREILNPLVDPARVLRVRPRYADDVALGDEEKG
jgi:hypothetical protein